MPTVMRIGPYRFFFYSNEGHEPRHIHIRSGDGEAKFWLEPIQLEASWNYNERELKKIERHIQDNLSYLIELWDEFFEGLGDDE
jgi:Domain of unknown function (DUF4160)